MTDSSITNSCVVCGRTSDLVCKKCKTEVYCCPECQLRHWKVHEPKCKRKDFAAAPCDVCGDTENEIIVLCHECGCLWCESCVDQIFDEDDEDEDDVDDEDEDDVDDVDDEDEDDDDTGETTLSIVPCPRCEKSMEYEPGSEGLPKLRKLIENNPHDPRLPQWLVLFGCLLDSCGILGAGEDGEHNAIKYFKRAGKLGLGEGYRRLAAIYLHKQNWKESKRYFQKAAALHDVTAIYIMSYEASVGFIHPRQEEKRDPNFEEAFRWCQLGAQLGDARSCADLGDCYSEGIGTEQNLVKGFKWSKRAAEQGNPKGMRQCGECYRAGEGVEQSNEHAIYWFEKSLELNDDEEIWNRLQGLQSL